MMEDLRKWAGENGAIHAVVTRDLLGNEIGRALIAVSGDVDLTGLAQRLASSLGNHPLESAKAGTLEQAG